MFFRVKKLHFIGIGGIGMSGIAEVLLNQGFQITGSDLQDSDIIAHLRTLGADVKIGHHADNVSDAQVVVYSSAVKPTNVEYKETQRLRIPIIPRAEMLSELMRIKYGIAIAGTHGKTTTTSMVASILTEANLDPTFIVGGRVKSLKTNAKLGSGEFLIAEADEYDRSFLRLTPTIAVITSLETEHLDTYGNLEEIRQAFLQFTDKIPFYGSIVLCSDELNVASLIPELQRPVITYGLEENVDIRAFNLEFYETQSSFDVTVHGEDRGNVTLNQPGLHNVRNALAAIGVAEELKIKFKYIRRGLNNFNGVERRFEIKGIFDDIMVVDDYAHHPTEVSATLAAAKNGWDRRIIAVFQPHLYSRTRDFAAAFGESFAAADVLIVTGIYGSREDPIEGITGQLIVDAAVKAGQSEAHYHPNLDELAEFVSELAQPGDMIITLGAGNIWTVAKSLVELLENEGKS
jgi:UDP-N-acetylmuramate--alanine ligase